MLILFTWTIISFKEHHCGIFGSKNSRELEYPYTHSNR